MSRHLTDVIIHVNGTPNSIVRQLHSQEVQQQRSPTLSKMSNINEIPTGINQQPPSREGQQQCSPTLSDIYDVKLIRPIKWSRVLLDISWYRVRMLVVIIFILFFVFWALFAIIGAAHFSKWYPRFSLIDVHIGNFSITDSQNLSYNMDILIEDRHFSSIRAIEYHSYYVRTSHADMLLGDSVIPRFHPHNGSLHLSTTQRVSRLHMGALGQLVHTDLNDTGRVALRIWMQGKATTPLFLLVKSYAYLTCDLIVSPLSPIGSQIVEKLCCVDFPCLKETTTCSVGRVGTGPDQPTNIGSGSTVVGPPECTTSCDKISTSCCTTDRKNPRSTQNICE